jgi:Cu/Ag efflux protein CusF
MTRRTSVLSLLALTLAGCGAKGETKRYDLRGEVRALDPSTKIATIKHEKIGDWMEAMTMEFRVKPDAEFQKLHVGDRIEAKVVVNDLSYYVTDVRVAPK